MMILIKDSFMCYFLVLGSTVYVGEVAFAHAFCSSNLKAQSFSFWAIRSFQCAPTVHPKYSYSHLSFFLYPLDPKCAVTTHVKAS